MARPKRFRYETVEIDGVTWYKTKVRPSLGCRQLSQRTVRARTLAELRREAGRAEVEIIEEAQRQTGEATDAPLGVAFDGFLKVLVAGGLKQQTRRIPLVPPFTLGFKHFGRLVQLGPAGEILPAGVKWLSYLRAFFTPRGSALGHHSVSRVYVPRIAALSRRCAVADL